jgi:hypothetical protein
MILLKEIFRRMASLEQDIRRAYVETKSLLQAEEKVKKIN